MNKIKNILILFLVLENSQFISLSNSGSPDIVKMNKGYEIGLNVTVRRDALSKKLEDDGIRVGLRSIF